VPLPIWTFKTAEILLDAVVESLTHDSTGAGAHGNSPCPKESARLDVLDLPRVMRHRQLRVQMSLPGFAAADGELGHASSILWKNGRHRF
jgi:hypothetical protein